MSEAFPGLPRPPGSARTPRRSSAVILWREGPRGREVFWIRRGEKLNFAGGFYAFPGGKVDEADQAIPVLGAGGGEAELVATASRELFEETGVLMARGADKLTKEERDGARRSILEGDLDFGAFLVDRQVALDSAFFTPSGRWITPPFQPVRFDAQFFLAKLPAGQEAEVWPGELADGGWVEAEYALSLWREGRALLHPPNRWAIECLARAAPPACLDDLRHPPYCDEFITHRIDFQQGLYLAALETPTLPPATHTNCYLVDLGDGLAVVDPGPSDEAELAKLDALLDEHAREGKPAKEVWLTHHHGDHTGGVHHLAKRGLPVLAHAQTAGRIPAPRGAVRLVEDGALLHKRWRALHTPGHARGHLCFLDEETGALLCGDMVSTVSTIVIDPPEGDMAEYLAQLERLKDLRPRTLYPAHGAPAPNAVGKLDEYLAHRRKREEKVLASAVLPGTLAEVTARAYDDTPSFMYPVAQRSCLASLEKLEREGKVRREGDRWRAV